MTTVKTAPNVLLHSPITDGDALYRFVEECLRDGVDLIAVWGAGCEQLHDRIDEIVVGDGTDESRFIVTSWHHDEPIEDVRNFVASWNGGDRPFREVRL